MSDDRRSWLLRYHPLSYGLLSLLFALPVLAGLLITWPDVANLPATFPGHWRTIVLFSTLISVGMGLRSVTPSSRLIDPTDDRAK